VKEYVPMNYLIKVGFKIMGFIHKCMKKMKKNGMKKIKK
jgi:hypothetical protein